MTMKIGELDGRWALMHKITLSLVPIMFATMIGAIGYQLTLNAEVKAFMNTGNRYTDAMASHDLSELRFDLMSQIRLVEKQVDVFRVSLQSATPEADRRLKVIETQLNGIQADITSMRISLAQFRISSQMDKTP